MKKLMLLMLTMILAGILVACGNDENTSPSNDAEKPKEIPVTKEKDDKKKGNSYTDGPLTEIGQMAIEEDGTKAELMNIINVNEKVDMAPIEVAIQSIKLLQKTDVGEEQLERIQLFSEKLISDPVNYVQIIYSAENTIAEDANWTGITHLILSNGEQINVVSNNFLGGMDFDSTFYGEVKKDGLLGIPYQGNPEDIKSVKIVFGSSVNPESYREITAEKQVTYEFD
ncbi:hypothetical protein MKZ26_08030 [Sporosarcina sp. FSL K6-6792]|uniref:hypothetical protein n=1 Tax=Sporosarcina sp. FSL K6-6792 TaxID=2921559 RepID=UPI0030FAE788